MSLCVRAASESSTSTAYYTDVLLVCELLKTFLATIQTEFVVSTKFILKVSEVRANEEGNMVPDIENIISNIFKLLPG